MLPRSLRPLCLLLFVLHVIYAEPVSPPSIVESPPAGLWYFDPGVGNNITLNCRATGIPSVQYNWIRSDERDSTLLSGGTVVITSSSQYPDHATYHMQCIASNGVGTAMSNVTRIVEAKPAVFQRVEPLDVPTMRVTVGDKLVIPCEPTNRGVPVPGFEDYTWSLSSMDHLADRGSKQLDRRVQIDDYGNLNIAFVKSEDFEDQSVLKCNIFNQILKASVGGSYARIVDSGETAKPMSQPRIMFYTNKTSNGSETIVVGLEGQTVSMRCFFSGRDVLIAWRREDGGSRPISSEPRIDVRDFNVRLQIGDLKRSDEGVYSCTGSNGAGHATFNTKLFVHAVPTFKRLEDAPHDINATVNENVRFHCNPHAIPEAKIEWYKNGMKIDPNMPPSKFQFSADRKSLTVSKVCKNDCSGPNDVMVIQCIARNRHGSAIANGYINVFGKTHFVIKPTDVIPKLGESATFTVKAEFDPDIPITYNWYHYDEDSACDNKWCAVYSVDGRTLLISSEDGSSLTIFDVQEHDMGTYRCVASNGVDLDTVEVKLVAEQAATPFVRKSFWWLVLMLIVFMAPIIAFTVFSYLPNSEDKDEKVEVVEVDEAAAMETKGELKAVEKKKEVIIRAPPRMRFLSCRLILTVMGFFGMINCYTLRVNLSMAIVAMVNTTYLHELEHSYSENSTGAGSHDVCAVEGENKTEVVEPFPGTFNWDEKTTGLILGAFFYGYTTTQVLGGTLAQKIGGKVLMLFGIAWTSVLTLLTPVITVYGGWGALFAVRLLEGMGEAVTYPAMVFMLSGWAPPLERSRMTTFMHAGGQMGTVLGMPISGLLCQWFGWEYVFYYFGALGLLWSICWYFTVYDTPATHPRISAEEREYIEKALETKKGPKKGTLVVPWCSIFKCVPLYALAVAHFTCNIGYYTLLTCLPLFFKHILHFDMKSNGVVSGAPYLFMWLFLVVSGWLADMVRTKNLLSTTNIRKIMNGTGFVVPALLLIATGYVNCNAALAVFLIIAAVAFLGISFAGWSVNHLDLAPPYAGTLMGLTNTFATLPGFIGPAVVGAITYRNQTIEAWRTVFFLGGGVFAFGTIFYGLLGSGEVQPWAKPKKTEADELETLGNGNKEADKEKDKDDKDIKEVV